MVLSLLHFRCLGRHEYDDTFAVRGKIEFPSFSDHNRGFSALNESPLTVYPATAIRLSAVQKNSSRPFRDHSGYMPPLSEICHLPPLSGNARTTI